MDRNGCISVGTIRQIDGAVRRALDGGWAPGGARGVEGRRFNCLTAAAAAALACTPWQSSRPTSTRPMDGRGRAASAAGGERGGRAGEHRVAAPHRSRPDESVVAPSAGAD